MKGDGEPRRPEAAVFCGIQGSGKTTFYRARFAATHARINLDELKTRHRERGSSSNRSSERRAGRARRGSS